MNDSKCIGKRCLVLSDIGAGKVTFKVLGRGDIVIGLQCLREKRLSETAGTDDEGKAIGERFEFGDELCLVDICKVICTQNRKVCFAVGSHFQIILSHFSPFCSGHLSCSDPIVHQTSV